MTTSSIADATPQPTEEIAPPSGTADNSPPSLPPPLAFTLSLAFGVDAPLSPADRAALFVILDDAVDAAEALGLTNVYQSIAGLACDDLPLSADCSEFPDEDGEVLADIRAAAAAAVEAVCAAAEGVEGGARV